MIKNLLEMAIDVIESECGMGGTNTYDPYSIVRQLKETLKQCDPVAEITRNEATLKLDWYSVDAAHNAKVGLLYQL